MNSEAPIRLGIVGAGHMGARHAACVRLIPEAQPTAVMSRTREHAMALAGHTGARVYQSLDELAGAPDVDAVLVCTPTDQHVEPALAAIRAGKPVVVEKPLTRTLAEAETLIEAADRAGVLLLTAQTVRWYPAMARLHDLVVEGTIGAPAVVRMARETGNAPEGWRADPARSGGAVLELGIHEFDWLLWTCGAVERVYCQTASRAYEAAQDYALTTLRFRSGALGHVESSMAGPAGLRAHGEIAGDGGLLTYDSARDTALVTDLEPPGRAMWDGVPTAFTDASPCVLQMRHWVRCIRGTETPLVRPSQAYEALKVALAALSSARSGEVVTL